MGATVTSKGQITIPKQVRDLLGIGPGCVVDFERVADELSEVDDGGQEEGEG